jgi:hypothetical protein
MTQDERDASREDDEMEGEDSDEAMAPEDELFVNLVSLFDSWVAESDDRDLVAAEHAVLRFGAVTTLMLMHDAIEDPENASSGLSREEMAKTWIADMCRDFAEMLMNPELISATAEMIGKPDIRLQFDRAFRRRMITG